MNQQFGWLLVLMGLLLVVVGLIWLFAPSIPWLGRLPGDIIIQGERTRVYIPVMTCLLLSVVFSVVLWVIRLFTS